jgi:mannose PTS system EIIA component
MPSILIAAHAPLASCLQAVAQHAYADCGGDLAAVDISPGASLDTATAQIAGALASLPAGEVLILTDVFGATPSNAALAASDGTRSRVVAGVNVPMLWRSLCYAKLPLTELVVRAAEGGLQGIMQVASPRRQNQPTRQNSSSDDPNANSDQQ